jgi:histidinol-phosphatase
MPKWDREVETAIAAARKAAEVALTMQAGIAFESKADGSPVTTADKACEAVIAATLLAVFPDDGLLGEEGAAAESRNGRRWIIDPIDGTRDYLRGTPLWANLIALEADGEVVVGVVNLPCLGGLYSASLGGGAFKDSAPIHASAKTSFAESVLCLNSMNKLDALPFREKLLQSIHEFWAVRSLGGAPDAMMVASGHADFWIEPTASPWDLAPLQIVIEEAGGRMFSFDGARGIYGGGCVACAPGLETSVRELLGL